MVESSEIGTFDGSMVREFIVPSSLPISMQPFIEKILYATQLQITFSFLALILYASLFKLVVSLATLLMFLCTGALDLLYLMQCNRSLHDNMAGYLRPQNAMPSVCCSDIEVICLFLKERDSLKMATN